ncbi:hypothetical protein [Candidatus Marithrix sp. Canyon 246]|uniref:hypothetical protein n=1 Tax=Candidatus Marithrix sp. Canyon 246 TaxID=1827136 RepID=UPI00084A2857|nr:hypothetical protein [Candidatus Marithrix sp. Canyon 246]
MKLIVNGTVNERYAFGAIWKNVTYYGGNANNTPKVAGNYILTSQFGKLAHNKLTLENDKRSITTEYTAPQNYEGWIDLLCFKLLISF